MTEPEIVDPESIGTTDEAGNYTPADGVPFMPPPPAVPLPGEDGYSRPGE